MATTTKLIHSYPAGAGFRSFLLMLIHQLDGELTHAFFGLLAELDDQELTKGIRKHFTGQQEKNVWEFIASLREAQRDEKSKTELDYPFDCFGSDVKGTVKLLHVAMKLAQTRKNEFTSILTDQHFIYLKTNGRFPDFKEKITDIASLRHHLTHQGQERRIEGFHLTKSLHALLLFLPDDYSRKVSNHLKNLVTDAEKIPPWLQAEGLTLAWLEENGKQIHETNRTQSMRDLTETAKENFQKFTNRYPKIASRKLFDSVRHQYFIGSRNIAVIKHIVSEEFNNIDANRRQTMFLGDHFDDNDHLNEKQLKKKREAISFEEISKIFNFFLELNGLLHRYFTVYVEFYPGKDLSEPMHKLRNNLNHAHIFLGRKEHTVLAGFSQAFRTILDFYNEYYPKLVKKHQNQELLPAAQMKSSFVQALKALCQRKDYLYLLVEIPKSKEKHRMQKQIISIHPQHSGKKNHPYRYGTSGC